MYIQNIIRYIKGIFMAMEDEKENYASLFLELHEEDTFLQSRYISYFAREYMSDYDKKITNKKAIIVDQAYTGIMHIYEDAYTCCKKIDDQILAIKTQSQNIEKKIEEKNDELDKLKKIQNKANQEGRLPEGSEFRSFEDLAIRIGNVENDIWNLETDNAKHQRQIAEYQKQINKIKRKKYHEIVDAVTDFNIKLKVLQKAVGMIERDYEKVYQSCRHFFQRRIKGSDIRKKYCMAISKYQTFGEICNKCGYQYIGQKDVFLKEREYINTVIKDFFNLNNCIDRKDI